MKLSSSNSPVACAHRARRPPLWGAAGLAVLALVVAVPLSGGAQVSPANADGSTSRVVLSPGQVQTLPVVDVVRVAVGDPEVADVTLISATQLLIKAKKMGTTNLILWEGEGQRELTVSVGKEEQEPQEIAQQVSVLLKDLEMSHITAKSQFGKIFLIGQVADDKQLQTLEQVVSTFGDSVVNLATVAPVVVEVTPPEPLVSLSVQVLEINRTDLDQLGVSWTQSVALTESALTASSISDQLMKIGESATRTKLVATLDALVKKNKARVLSEPKLVTASGKEASSFIGVEVPILTATAVGTGTASVSASIDYRQTGVLLKMTPYVRPNDELITINMSAEVSGMDTSVGLQVPVGTQTILVPGFKSRKANTEVTAATGETIVIAGLLEAEDSDSMTQVPGLGNLPVIGRLFRSPILQSTKRELVITVTPELLDDASNDSDRRLALERALAVAEVTASVDDPRLRYALQVQDRIAKSMRYPQREKELNLEGTVKLRLHLFADGTLGRATVAESSGVEALDLEALKAAESQAPYPGFPTQMAERELWLEVPVIFRP